MFYRWAKRLETMQLPVTAFPAAAADPAESEESHDLDGALIWASIASLWVLLQSLRSTPSAAWVNVDRAVITYGPIFLVAVIGALLLRPQASLRPIATHIAAYLGLSALMGVIWMALGRHAVTAIPAVDVIVWGTFFAVFGLVTAVLCTVAWASALRQLATPRTALNAHASQFRLLCLGVTIAGALVGALKAINVMYAGL